MAAVDDLEGVPWSDSNEEGLSEIRADGGWEERVAGKPWLHSPTRYVSPLPIKHRVSKPYPSNSAITRWSSMFTMPMLLETCADATIRHRSAA